MKKIIFLLIVIASFGCKKGYDDTLIGTWDVFYYSINGHDTTRAIKSQPCYAKLNFNYDDTKGDYNISGSYSNTCSTFGGTFNLLDGTHIKMEITSSGNFNRIGAYGAVFNTWPEIPNWNIQHILKKDLIVVLEYNGELNTMWLKKD